MMGSSSSVVITVSLFPRLKIGDRFLKVALLEKNPFLAVSSVPIKSSLSAVSSNYGGKKGKVSLVKNNEMVGRDKKKKKKKELNR